MGVLSWYAFVNLGGYSTSQSSAMPGSSLAYFSLEIIHRTTLELTVVTKNKWREM